MHSLQDLDKVAQGIEDAKRAMVEAFHHYEMTDDYAPYEAACLAHEEAVTRSYADYGAFWPQVREDLQRQAAEDEANRYGEPPEEMAEQCEACGATERLELSAISGRTLCASCALDEEIETDEGPWGDPRTPEERASDEYYARHPEELRCPFCGTPVTLQCEHSVTSANLRRWAE